MKETLKRLLCLMMALLMVLALVACGEEEEESTSRRKRKNTETTSDTTESGEDAFRYEAAESDEETTEEKVELSKEAKKLVGTWTAEIDASDLLNESLVEELTGSGLEMDLEVKDVVLSLTMTFNEDGTCEMVGDASRAVTAMENFVDEFIDEFWNYIVEMGVKETGMSVEEVEKGLQQEGMTKEALREELGAQLDFESFFGNEDEMHMTGKWLLDGDELYVGEEDPKDEGDPVVIEFKGNDEFHIVEIPDDPDGMGQYVLPFVFKRV